MTIPRPVNVGQLRLSSTALSRGQRVRLPPTDLPHSIREYYANHRIQPQRVFLEVYRLCGNLTSSLGKRKPAARITIDAAPNPLL
jgi:hypothetical protein